MKKIAVVMLFAAVAAVLVFASCDDRESANEIPVGVVLPFSGPHASIGVSMRKAMEFALEEIHESPLLGDQEIRFIFGDSKSNRQSVREAYTKLIEQDEVAAVLGPFSSSRTEDIIDIIDKNRTVSLSPTSAAMGLSARSEFLFRSSLTVERLVPHGVEESKRELNYTKVAMITNAGDTFSASAYEAVKREIEKDRSISIVSDQTYTVPSSEELPDLTAQLTQIANSGAEYIFMSAQGTERTGILVQAERVDGLEASIIGILLTTNEIRDAQQEEAGAGKGALTFTVWLPSIDTPENRKFRDEYKERTGEDASSFTARAYEAVRIFAQSVADAGSTDREAIRDAMENVRLENSIYGSDFYFDLNGDAVYDPVVGIEQDGGFKVLGQ
ncbi:MAG: ABC transporter substrate-binding protein [Candidatus Dadabacteria bacterium]|nr:ABC transporter substrate-binding protein [Candidatus Dadabacteria bacterium]MYC40735.1 ABC transporter substrate-binding protein [Candidatus Dadabacteria bacterium]